MIIKQRTVAALALLSLLAAQGGCGRRGGNTTGSARPAPHFKPGFNLFKPEQDIELGRQSAQQVERQVPLLRDDTTLGYIRELGAKLASKAPGYNFPYQFNVVATKEINAFALPGGFVYVNAGVVMAAKNEGEIAGVMAHEISHVALRHGTNQASKAYLAKAGLDVLGAITGGSSTDIGQVINTVGGVGANALFLKFGRAAETQADLEGARIMAEAGYDPRDMASFFKTLEEKSGQRTPEFLSDHPDPGNRIAAINAELRSLPVSPNPIHDTEQFEAVKDRLTGGAKLASREPARIGPHDPNDNKSGERPPPPSSSFKEFESSDGAFALRYPDNWDALVADDSNMIFAPKGAYGKLDDSLVVTHGIFIGAIAPEGNDLGAATAAFVEQQIRSNPDFHVQGRPQQIDIRGRQGYATVVAGPSPVTGVIEIDVIYTTATGDGRLFYFITIAPEDEYQGYKPAFEQIIGSIRLMK